MFKKNDYIVILELEKGYSDSCGKKNYCFKVQRDEAYLTMYRDLNGSSNGHSILTFNKFKDLLDWRYADELEIEEYDELNQPYDVTTLERFVLPNMWACKVNDLNERGILNEYVKKRGYSATFSDNWYVHYPFTQSGGSGYSTVQKNYTEITFNQFKKYVLNEKDIRYENLDYLIDILTKINNMKKEKYV